MTTSNSSTAPPPDDREAQPKRKSSPIVGTRRSGVSPSRRVNLGSGLKQFESQRDDATAAQQRGSQLQRYRHDKGGDRGEDADQCVHAPLPGLAGRHGGAAAKGPQRNVASE